MLPRYCTAYLRNSELRLRKSAYHCASLATSVNRLEIRYTHTATLTQFMSFTHKKWMSALLRKTAVPNHFNPELYFRRHYVPTLRFSAANIHAKKKCSFLPDKVNTSVSIKATRKLWFRGYRYNDSLSNANNKRWIKQQYDHKSWMRKCIHEDGSGFFISISHAICRNS